MFEVLSFSFYSGNSKLSDIGNIHRKETKQDHSATVLDAGTRHGVFHKQIPLGNEAFDVQ